MLKLLVTFALIAACSAVTDRYFVDVGTNHVTVGNDVGHKVYFTFNELTGNYPIIKVDITGPQGHIKTMEFEEVYCGHDQIEKLYHIFSQYVGQLDTITYNNLLDTVFQWVQMNKIHPIVLHALKFLNVGYHGNQYGDIFGRHGQGMWTQGIRYPYNSYKGLYGYQPYGGLYQRYGNYGPYSGVYGHGLWGKSGYGHGNWGQNIYNQGFWGKNIYDQGLWGKNIYGQGLWGKNIYDQGLWGQNVYGRGFWGQNVYGKQYGQRYPQNLLTHYQEQLAY